MINPKYLLTLAFVAGAFAIPATASGDSAAVTVSIAGNATLISDPGPIVVTVHYSCVYGGVAGDLSVIVDEQGVYSTSGQFVTCDDQNHSTPLTVPGPFVPGTASVLAELCNGLTCAAVDNEVAIK